MKKKKNLWSGVSMLIVAVLAVTAFIRGKTQIWLYIAAFAAWSVWAGVYFLIPYMKEQFHRYEARRIRKKCERQDAGKPKFIIPDISEPVETVLLRHVNYRISSYLQSVYPDVTWEWRCESPQQIVAKGGTGRIKLYGVHDFNYADVTFDTNAGIDCALMNVVPMAKLRNTAPVAETEKPTEQPADSEKQRNPIDPQVWYEVQGRKVLETLITDLHSRGHSSLTIRENGDVVIKQADSDMVRSKLESVPEKTYWPRLCKVFEREGLAANITDGGILLSW